MTARELFHGAQVVSVVRLYAEENVRSRGMYFQRKIRGLRKEDRAGDDEEVDFVVACIEQYVGSLGGGGPGGEDVIDQKGRAAWDVGAIPGEGAFHISMSFGVAKAGLFVGLANFAKHPVGWGRREGSGELFGQKRGDVKSTAAKIAGVRGDGIDRSVARNLTGRQKRTKCVAERAKCLEIAPILQATEGILDGPAVFEESHDFLEGKRRAEALLTGV